MKPAARNGFSLVVRLMLGLLLAAGTTQMLRAAPPPAAGTRDLFAHGSDQFFWAADVVPGKPNEVPATVTTTIRFRTAGDQLRWQKAGVLSAQPISLANRSNELLVVLDDGSWKIVSESGVRSGIDLPNGYKVLALAGEGDDIWAAGSPDPARQKAGAPATTSSSTAATVPASQPQGMALFKLRHGSWSHVDSLPVNFKREHVFAISLAELDDRLTLAIVGLDRAVRVYTRASDGWGGAADVGTLGPEARTKLLSIRGRPALWIAEPNTTGRIYFRSGDKWELPIKLGDSPKLNAFDRRDLAYALGQLRLLASDGKGRLAEQLYDERGALQGQASEGVIDRTDAERRVSQVIQFIVLAVLVVWMLGALRQRPNLQEALARIESLNVAPLTRRFTGGLVDLSPLLVGALLASFAVQHDPQPAGTALSFSSPEVAWICAGLGVYFLHVTVLELIHARSLGKIVTGTRVTTLDGSRPAPAAILTRNIMRLVDLILLFVPLLSVFSPLRQRVGDMAAGTIVVMNAPSANPPSAEPPSSSGSNQPKA